MSEFQNTINGNHNAVALNQEVIVDGSLSGSNNPSNREIDLADIRGLFLEAYNNLNTT